VTVNDQFRSTKVASRLLTIALSAIKVVTFVRVLLNLSQKKTKMPAVAEKVDRTAHDSFINYHLDNKTRPCSYQRKQNGHVINKARYNKEVKSVNFGGRPIGV